MDKKILYQNTYDILAKVTPLKKDCGNLCNKACCQGMDKESGMYLYPGEEELQLQYATDFLTIKSVDFLGHPILVAICKGECKRNQRPIACRVFPLTAYYTSKDIMIVIMDPRARHLCPLARTLKKSDLNLEFIAKVRQAFQLLSSDPEIKEFIEKQSRALDEFIEIESRFI